MVQRGVHHVGGAHHIDLLHSPHITWSEGHHRGRMIHLSYTTHRLVQRVRVQDVPFGPLHQGEQLVGPAALVVAEDPLDDRTVAALAYQGPDRPTFGTGQ